ncbi:MAG: EAL domain-containing protein, partial [Proteobacteria bacterium]|nr:EAL domain-containing protein [Candidatus Avisuccinivibrio stercorigallinarum]
DLILTASNKYTALQWVLENLGHYYRADRVYVLQLIENSLTVEELGEWDASGKPSFRGMLTGMHIDKTPLLRRAIDTQQPVILARRDRSVVLQNDNSAYDLSSTWAFSAYPFIAVKNDFKAVLCIDNPHAQENNLALVAALKVYLLNLLQQLVEERFDDEGGQILGGNIYGLKDFNAQLPQLTSEIYTSMGAFTISVPQMLQLSHEYGYEHCFRLLNFIKELLTRSFGNSFIFNVLEHEFVILVPNTIKEIFFDRVKRVQDVINHNYAGQVFYGATWSRGSFVSENLVKEAVTLMLSSLPGLNCRVPVLPDELENLNAGSPSMLKQFTVHFQPKIDMHTGTVVGAEALVRGVADDGSIVSPGRFIAKMEKSGMLRDLDLFVLSRVLWQQQEWKHRGFKVVPVSVNFSRFTMFDSATAGAVLAILSHYEEECSHDIEIELTETACAVENVTLNRAMMPFRNLGLSFALDDFGTGYANLSIFSKVHFDSIKLDRSLITDIAVNKVSQSLLESIVRISHDSSMKVIAEGVEHQEQVDVLLKSGCYLAQGFLYDRALEPDKFAQKYLKRA